MLYFMQMVSGASEEGRGRRSLLDGMRVVEGDFGVTGRRRRFDAS